MLPESAIPGSATLLNLFHDRIEDIQIRFLRVIAEAIGCHESFFDEMTHNGATLTRAIRYPPMTESPGGAHVWAGSHGDINLITALPRSTAPGLQVKVGDDWVDAVAPEGQVIINTGMMLERITNGVLPTGIHRVVAAPGYTGRALQRRAVLPSDAMDVADSARQLHHPLSTRSVTRQWSVPTRSTWCCTRSTSSRTPARRQERRSRSASRLVGHRRGTVTRHE